MRRGIYADLAELEGSLGHSFKNPALLLTAVTHTSYANEHSGRSESPIMHNERLEFLGDAVLSLLVTHLLMLEGPERAVPRTEGQLTLLRSKLVSESSLCGLAKSIELGKYLRLGKGEDLAGGRSKPSLLADAFEAVLGALYLDTDFAYCLTIGRRLLGSAIADVAERGGSDHKSALQEILQAEGTRPRYELVASQGPEHDKRFDVAVYVGEQLLAQGSGRTKRAAEHAAAELALEVLSAR